MANQPPSAPTITSPNGGETWNKRHTITWVAASDPADTWTDEPSIPNNHLMYSNAHGQTFTVTSTDKITSIEFYGRAETGQSGNNTWELWDEYAGAYGGTKYASGTVYISSSGNAWRSCVLPTPLSFAVGKKLALRITGSDTYFAGDVYNPYAGGNYFNSGGASYDYDLQFRVNYKAGVASNALKYQVQLSTDNKASWNDLATLTAAGVTSLDYDFTSKPATSQAYIRVRAYDGVNYGPWDESNAAFTIQHNRVPTITLTSPSNNLSLSEGSTYTLAGTASDPDNGNAVTVKYAINGGTARNITSAISDGSTAIPFSKTLTFQNGRLYDGETDVSGPLAENTTYTLSVWAVDDQGGTSTSYTRTFTVILNRPPTINLDAYNANQTGVSELEALTFTGTLTDPENDTITLTAAFNGGAPVTIKSAVASGTTFTYSVPVSSLAQGSNTVVFTATDPKGASSTKMLTFTKSGTFTPVKTAVVRYAITPPLGTTAEIAAWVQREAGDLTVDAAASIVGSADPETYVALTKNASVPLGDGTIVEDEFVGAVAQPGAKAALRLTLTRENTSSTAAVKKIMGGIG
ncbi:Ig-like domain-containing protein [Brevibacillus agri]|uniref:Ig-like domain-containing protein n=1 Tax=Brevibacillus agri TaxID=51101 RepID=UPI000470F15C|nr:Ig-like domain-containing protein [Brevibacillus agri]